MGLQTIGAILNAIGQILETAAALVAQCIKGTVAKQAIKILRVHTSVTGEILTFPILEEFIIGHITPLSREIREEAHG